METIEAVRQRIKQALDGQDPIYAGELADAARSERLTETRRITDAVEARGDANLLQSEQRRHDALVAEVRELDSVVVRGVAEGRRQAIDNRDASIANRAAAQRAADEWAGSSSNSNLSFGGLIRTGDSDAWLAPTNEVLQRMYDLGLRCGAERVEHRSTVTSALTGANDLATQLELSVREPRRLAATAQIPVSEVTGIELSKYPVFGSADAAGVTSEGSVKAEFDDISEGTATPSVVALWTTTSRQNVMTMTNFVSKLLNVHLSRVARREDELLIATVQATATVSTTSGVVGPDTILKAAALVADSDVGTVPNAFVLHPSNVVSVFGSTVGTGGSASPNFHELDLQLHGMRCYISSAIATSESIVASWNAGSRFIYGWRPQTFVDAVSGLKSNLITYLTEEAVALAIDEPSAFVRATLTT